MANFDDISFTQMTFTEGSAPSTPATSNWKIYTKTDGLYVIDDAGTEIGPLGAGGGGPTVAYKTAAESVTSSTTLQNDDDLLIAVGANEIWAIDCVLFVDGATGGDIKATITGPSGATGRVSVTGPGTSASTFENATGNNQAAALGAAPPAGTLGAGNVVVVTVHCYMDTAGTAGNATLQWAQNSSSGTATRVLDGSYMIGHQLA